VTRTTCPYCGVGCGLKGELGGARALRVAADESHPANQGRICSKGAALGDTVGLSGRLLAPIIGDRPVSWDRALTKVATALRRVIQRHGPDAVAFYVSGQLLTEDYYAANKLMKGFIGSANIDTNSRLCMASAVVAHTKAFGGDFVPGCYEDLDVADLIVFSGHNAAWTHPVLYRRMEAAKARGQKHIVLDPRRTDTAEGADLHLPIAPQSDVRLWNGLLAHLIRVGALDRGYIDAHVSGFAEVERALSAQDQSVAAVAVDCGVEARDLQRFYTMFAETPRTVTLFSMGVNQSAQGVVKGLAIINAHLATGRIGKPGACPFSITGQPNAMGGRETGGMATTLAAHMGFDELSCDRVARFWSAPHVARKPGLKAIDMFDAIHDGRIKALWVMATNPAVSLPNSNRVREALARCPLVVVSDCMASTDTMAFAHVKLPALAWGEKDGTVTNSERRISRQRALMPPPSEARADWRIIADVAARMGYGDAFSWHGSADVFREYARLTAYENEDRILDLSDLAALSQNAYDQLEPRQWPHGAPRLFTDGRFATSDGRARMHVLQPSGPAIPVSRRFPLSLNTGRVRDHWHTMTRTALAPQLCRHTPEPVIEMHPSDAEAAGVRDGALTCIETADGQAAAVARVSDRQRRGSLFMPMHWTDAYAPSGKVNAMTTGAVDPFSGQPEFKHTPARMYGYRETWRGFCISRAEAIAPDAAIVWRRIPILDAQLYEFAGRGDVAERDAVRRALMAGARGECVRLEDASAGSMREAFIDGDRLDRVLFIGMRLPARDWLAEAFAAPLSDETRKWLLHARPPGAASAGGPIVCACANVSASKILAAIQQGSRSMDEIGAATRAGVTCGSCRPELRRMLETKLEPESANAA
jgi:assimilatory nitrate reductase catalytic subunit